MNSDRMAFAQLLGFILFSTLIKFNFCYTAQQGRLAASCVADHDGQYNYYS